MLYPKDPQLTVQQSPDAVQFNWRPTSTAIGVFLICVGILLTVAGVLAGSAPLSTGEPRSKGEVIGLISLMGGFGLFVSYYGLAGTLGRTQLRADQSTISRWTGPLPWSRRVTYPAQGVKQFFAQGRTYNSTTGSSSYGSVYLIDAQDHAHLVATGLPSSFAANQVCHVLEDFYGIEDMPVYGVTTDPTHPGPRPTR